MTNNIRKKYVNFKLFFRICPVYWGLVQYFITMNEWKTLASKISEINFWKLKSFVDDDGKDGSEWILEGKNNYEYHFVNRWSPNATRYKEFKDCCDYLIYLSNIKLTDKEIY